MNKIIGFGLYIGSLVTLGVCYGWKGFLFGFLSAVGYFMYNANTLENE